MIAMQLDKSTELNESIDKMLINMFNPMGANLLAQVVRLKNWDSFFFTKHLE